MKFSQFGVIWLRSFLQLLRPELSGLHVQSLVTCVKLTESHFLLHDDVSEILACESCDRNCTSLIG